jgi:hypothetical protein
MRALATLATLAVGACYEPAVARCVVTDCSDEAPCPGDLVCRGGSCVPEGDKEPCPQQHRLAIEMGGRGKGIVAGPDGLLCPGQVCSVDVVEGEYTLTPLPAVESRLAEWTMEDGSPIADCLPDRPCTLNLDSDVTVRATFNAAKAVEVRFFGDGEGHLASADGILDCRMSESRCIAKFDVGADVILRPVPDEDGVNPAALVRWGGDCEGTAAQDPCTINLEENRTVDVHFDLHRVMLFPVPADGGTIRRAGTNIMSSCPGECELLFPPATNTVDLIATPGPDRLVGRWINVCDSLLPVPVVCNATIDRDMFVVVLFDEMPRLSVVPNAAVNILVKPGDLPCNNVAGGECVFHFAPDTQVTVTATPKMGQLDPSFEWNTCPNQANERSSQCNFQIRAGDTITLNPGVVL